jgi:hypothetical protein
VLFLPKLTKIDIVIGVVIAVLTGFAAIGILAYIEGMLS